MSEEKKNEEELNRKMREAVRESPARIQGVAETIVAVIERYDERLSFLEKRLENITVIYNETIVKLEERLRKLEGR